MHRRCPPAVHALAVWADQLSTAGGFHTQVVADFALPRSDSPVRLKR